MPHQIYLDHNLIGDFVQGKQVELRSTVDVLKSRGNMFPYSPAHIEEIAVILRSQPDEATARQFVEEHFRVIREISDCWEYLPALDDDPGPTRLLQEDPAVCMDRVLAYYDRTLYAEQNERFVLRRKSADVFDQVQQELGSDARAVDGIELDEDWRRRMRIDVREINGLDPLMLFNDPKVHEGFRQKLIEHRMPPDNYPRGDIMLQDHKTREVLVNFVLKYFDKIGYHPDKFKNHRSQMHDVTHAIYGASSDFLVSNDRRFRDRVTAAYSILEIETIVIGPDEFLQLPDLIVEESRV